MDAKDIYEFMGTTRENLRGIETSLQGLREEMGRRFEEQGKRIGEVETRSGRLLEASDRSNGWRERLKPVGYVGTGSLGMELIHWLVTHWPK